MNEEIHSITLVIGMPYPDPILEVPLRTVESYRFGVDLPDEGQARMVSLFANSEAGMLLGCLLSLFDHQGPLSDWTGLIDPACSITLRRDFSAQGWKEAMDNFIGDSGLVNHSTTTITGPTSGVVSIEMTIDFERFTAHLDSQKMERETALIGGTNRTRRI